MAVRRLPPLNALRAFEAASRHLSIKAAAADLNVTPGAISQQLKLLEESLGLKLFDRRHQAITLTPAGQNYFPAVRRAFESLLDATERLLPDASTAALNISVMPSFAIKWLVPRLGRFQAIHPNVDVRISSSNQLVDFGRDREIDLAVRHGRGRWPGVTAEFLFGERFTPVCSPKLLSGPHPLKTPADLVHHVLLQDALRADWAIWCQAVGLSGIEVSRGPAFSDDGLRLQAAIDGVGVAMGYRHLIAEDLRAGRLVAPFDLTITGETGYYLVFPPRSVKNPTVQAFRAWMLDEVAEV